MLAMSISEIPEAVVVLYQCMSEWATQPGHHPKLLLVCAKMNNIFILLVVHIFKTVHHFSHFCYA